MPKPASPQEHRTYDHRWDRLLWLGMTVLIATTSLAQGAGMAADSGGAMVSATRLTFLALVCGVFWVILFAVVFALHRSQKQAEKRLSVLEETMNTN